MISLTGQFSICFSFFFFQFPIKQKYNMCFFILQLSDFLFGQLGLVFGSNAVITNGRVSFMVHVNQLNES
jgi:hypothetical protein